MDKQSQCAHLHVDWKTEQLPGGLTRGWWECHYGCGAKFAVWNPVPSETAEHAPMDEAKTREWLAYRLEAQGIEFRKPNAMIKCTLASLTALVAAFAAALPDERETRMPCGHLKGEEYHVPAAPLRWSCRGCERESATHDAALEEAAEQAISFVAWGKDAVQPDFQIAIAAKIRALKQVRPEVETSSPSSRRIGGEKEKR